jgi:hypothetical protein
MLEWIVETQGYSVTELETVGATDAELEERVAEYLAKHPLSSTTTVETEVQGTATRIRKVLDRPRLRRRQTRGSIAVPGSDPVGVGKRRGDGVNPHPAWMQG